MVPIFGAITFVLLVFIVLSDKSYIYEWLGTETVKNSEALKGKTGFLNKPFFIIWTLLTIVLWSLLGARMRKLSSEADEGRFDFESGKNYIWRNTVTASLFIVWFALTTASVTPWMWLMSIDAKWYSTMYSWYTFISTFVSGLSLIALWMIYLKNKGYLELSNQEHLHDIGKFMFAFSIFWTYLWFSQYMLIWYANIPEETTYFMPRVLGAYRGIFFLNPIIKFCLSVAYSDEAVGKKKLYFNDLYGSADSLWSLDRFLPDGYGKFIAERGYAGYQPGGSILVRLPCL